MTYIDGYVIPVPTTNKQAFLEQARAFDQMLIDNGALRVVECWGDDVQRGHATDFFGSVQATAEETVVFSWVEWPDKAARDAGSAAVMELMKTDPKFDPANGPPMSFDGKRMIYGGFAPILELGE